MTAPVAPAPRSIAWPTGAAVVAAVGCALLAARPAIVAVAPRPVTALIVLYVALLVVGATIPLAHPRWSDPVRPCPTLLIGVTAFAFGRALAGGHTGPRAGVLVIVANVLAAVAEEVWFRRLCFGLLEDGGALVAILGSSVLFAAVHVASYGFWVVPLDLAAGAVLGWQRAVTGSWTVSAATHALANVLVLL